MRKPSLTSLRQFVEIANSRNFSETARKLNLSQPALSRSIRILEEMLDQRLFDRTTRSVELTWAGDLLLPVANRLIADFDQAFEKLEHDFSGREGRLVIGALPSIAAGGLPHCLSRFGTSNPDVEIVLHEGLASTLHAQLIAGSLDFAICTPSEENEELEFFPIFEDPYGVTCRKDDPLAAVQSPDWSVFLDRAFIAMSNGSSIRQVTDDGFARSGHSVTPHFECSYLASLGQLIATGFGVSAVPATCMSQLITPDITWRAINDPLASRTIGIVKVRGRSLMPAVSALTDLIMEELAAMRPASLNSSPTRISHL